MPADSDYEAFIRNLQLIALGLNSCSSHLDRTAFFEALRKETKLRRRFTEDYRVSGCGEKYFDCEGKFSVTISEQDSKATKPLLTIECVFEVHMHGDPPVDKRFAERFATSELRFLLLPFARQFVSNTTANMHIPPVVLPLD